MPYVSASGQIQPSRYSRWGLSLIPQIFWDVVDFLYLFFGSLLQPLFGGDGNGSESSSYRSGGSGGGRWPPPGPPRRRMGGFGPTGGISPPPPMMGGG